MSIMRRLKSLKKSWMRNQIKPLAAWRAMCELLRNPDDTAQVFHIIEALKGDSLGGAVRRLRATSRGRALLQMKPDIVPMLNDREGRLVNDRDGRRMSCPRSEEGRAACSAMAAAGVSTIFGSRARGRSKRPLYSCGWRHKLICAMAARLVDERPQ